MGFEPTSGIMVFISVIRINANGSNGYNFALIFRVVIQYETAPEMADVNEDGEVNIGDATKNIDIILSDDSN